ncbi:hypothetical protein Tco_0304342 [Tanacetum coccineum]
MDDLNITIEEYIRLEEEKARKRDKVFNWETAKTFCKSSTYHEFDLKDETSLSECDEEEQNVLCFNDLFPFNVIYPDDSKSDKDNDDDKIDIKHSLGGNVMNTDDGSYAQSTVYMAYSLNEYSVFDTGINTAYPGVWIRRIDFLYSFRPRERNIDKYWWRIYKFGDLEVLES